MVKIEAGVELDAAVVLSIAICAAILFLAEAHGV